MSDSDIVKSAGDVIVDCKIISPDRDGGLHESASKKVRKTAASKGGFAGLASLSTYFISLPWTLVLVGVVIAVCATVAYLLFRRQTQRLEQQLLNRQTVFHQQLLQHVSQQIHAQQQPTMPLHVASPSLGPLRVQPLHPPPHHPAQQTNPSVARPSPVPTVAPIPQQSLDRTLSNTEMDRVLEKELSELVVEESAPKTSAVPVKKAQDKEEEEEGLVVDPSVTEVSVA